MVLKVTVDFETRSHAQLVGPKSVGAWLYSRHPTTEVMCFSWCHSHDPETVFLWHPAYPHLGIEEQGRWELDLLLDAVRAGKTPAPANEPIILEAHNAFFEQSIWRNVCVPKLGWPEAPVRMWRCSAAKASAHSLPRSLEDACKARRTAAQKDLLGGKVMKKLSKPRKDGTWVESRGEFEVLWEYNRQDVRAEHEFSESLADLSPEEQEMWFMDQEVNLRGVLVDRLLCEKALELVDELKARNNVRFRELTGLASTGQRAAFQAFCGLFGLDLPDTRGETLVRALERGVDDPELAEAVRLVYESNRTSTKKYETALRLMDADDRIRGAIMFLGAERTGRWSGKGIQPHNYPRGFIKDMDAACQFILDSDLDEILRGMNLYAKEGHTFADVMEFLSHALRGMIVAEPGRVLAVTDFAAIEARVVLWYAHQLDALEIFRSGHCIYCDMASDIYGYPCNKKEHPDERQMGKQAILGLGFNMGAPKFVATCEKYGIAITDEFSERVVKLYRKKYSNVPLLWTANEEAAIAATQEPGAEHVVRAAPGAPSVTWVSDGDFLRCYLPSGRPLVYPEPTLNVGLTYYFKAIAKDGTEQWLTVNNPNCEPWSSPRVVAKGKATAALRGARLKSEAFFEREKFSLKYAGIDKDPKTNRAGPIQKWGWVHTYGGKLVENIVQATARDLMADAMKRVHESEDYDVCLSVHDELVTEVDAWVVDQHEFDSMMAEAPGWAEGCPIGAEGWSGLRYRK